MSCRQGICFKIVCTTKSCLLILRKARSSSVFVLAKTFVIKLACLANLPEVKQHDVPVRELICRSISGWHIKISAPEMFAKYGSVPESIWLVATRD